MHKKIITLGILCSLIASSSTNAFAATNNSTTLNKGYSYTQNTQNQLTQDDLNKIKGCITRQSDGTLKLDKKEALNLGYKEDILDKLESYLSRINKMILSKELQTDENLNITIVKNPQSNLVPKASVAYQGLDYVVYHWWGEERYANNTNAKALASQLGLMSEGAVGQGAAGKFIEKVFGVAMPEASEALAVVGGAYWGLLSRRITANNRGHGVIIDLTWIGVFSISPQL